MNYKIDMRLNFRKLVTATLLIIALIPLAIKTQNKSKLAQWQATYHINDDHILTQDLKNGICSFIVYLLMRSNVPSTGTQATFSQLPATEPNEQKFNAELQTAMASYPNYQLLVVNNFRQAMQRLFTNSYLDAYKQGNFDKNAWQKSLLSYYKILYDKLDNSHTNFGYGPLKGRALPKP